MVANMMGIDKEFSDALRDNTPLPERLLMSLFKNLTGGPVHPDPIQPDTSGGIKFGRLDKLFRFSGQNAL